jgi:hypothetical protein
MDSDFVEKLIIGVLPIGGAIGGAMVGSFLTQKGARTARQEQLYLERIEECYTAVAKIYKQGFTLDERLRVSFGNRGFGRPEGVPEDLIELKDSILNSLAREGYVRAKVLSDLFFPAVSKSLLSAEESDKHLWILVDQYCERLAAYNEIESTTRDWQWQEMLGGLESGILDKCQDSTTRDWQWQEMLGGLESGILDKCQDSTNELKTTLGILAKLSRKQTPRKI